MKMGKRDISVSPKTNKKIEEKEIRQETLSPTGNNLGFYETAHLPLP